MDLRTESPFWLMRSGIVRSYPSIKQSYSTDVAIMGGGITGALIAYHLTEAGIPAIVLDKRKIGMGSTCASTSLLQYEIDTPLGELTKYVGSKNANQSYLMCVEAIQQIHKIVKSLKKDVGFSLKKSFYYASTKKDVKEIKTEYQLRKNIGIELELLSEEDIKGLFPFSAPAALLSETGAQVDAYSFTHELLNHAMDNGLCVFDKTEVVKINQHKSGVELHTNFGDTVKAKKLIIACGYESQEYLSQKVVDFNSSFAIVSEPLETKNLWYQNCLIWETARPYLYIRTTDDNRILIGGKDEPFYNPDKRDKLTGKKALQLEKAFEKKFPDLDFRTDFRWAGTFAETKDGLPYIGKVDEHPDTYFALGFGGNGIVFSQIAAEIIRDALVGKKNAGEAIFRFDR
ncbi:NAD(P)/FAD-dependent oxidoreductase [Emticicia agri]|uniref:FAD-binding oxidoreductase n=1 Tax=Emticicia agri TaxID=2492393 RepID=A0A4Q5M1S1_9BACT|nr:FAD-dependent oxidoreductase [Emticicia agri]RYU96191.1 FAD-binding oxidoreductase [Emticicia agri]